jgi:hypothetical protein
MSSNISVLLGKTHMPQTISRLSFQFPVYYMLLLSYRLHCINLSIWVLSFLSFLGTNSDRKARANNREILRFFWTPFKIKIIFQHTYWSSRFLSVGKYTPSAAIHIFSELFFMIPQTCNPWLTQCHQSRNGACHPELQVFRKKSNSKDETLISFQPYKHDLTDSKPGSLLLGLLVLSISMIDSNLLLTSNYSAIFLVVGGKIATSINMNQADLFISNPCSLFALDH